MYDTHFNGSPVALSYGGAVSVNSLTVTEGAALP